jgi:hypothetical protein
MKKLLKRSGRKVQWFYGGWLEGKTDEDRICLISIHHHGVSCEVFTYFNRFLDYEG